MSVNWMRHFELQLLDSNGQGISLHDFKVTFHIQCADTKFPRVANVKIYNLSTNTQNSIMGDEYAKIRIIAGYNGIAPDVTADAVGRERYITGSEGQANGTNYGLIFSGEIRFTCTGRDNPTDSWVQVQALDGHRAYMYANVQTTLAAGYTAADLYAVNLKAMEPYGITQGLTAEFPSLVFPRGRTIFKNVRDSMDHVAAMCGATWQIVDSQLQMIPEDKYVHEAVVLNSNTGLVGMPQQTMGGGVNVRCLINPNIKINGLIQIDQASVYRAALAADEIAKSTARMREETLDGNRVVNGTIQQPASIAADGVYIVKSIDYTGDTRGQPWYMDMMCFARGARDLLSNSAKEKALL